MKTSKRPHSEPFDQNKQNTHAQTHTMTTVEREGRAPSLVVSEAESDTEDANTKQQSYTNDFEPIEEAATMPIMKTGMRCCTFVCLYVCVCVCWWVWVRMNGLIFSLCPFSVCLFVCRSFSLAFEFSFYCLSC